MRRLRRAVDAGNTNAGGRRSRALQALTILGPNRRNQPSTLTALQVRQPPRIERRRRWLEDTLRTRSSRRLVLRATEGGPCGPSLGGVRRRLSAMRMVPSWAPGREPDAPLLSRRERMRKRWCGRRESNPHEPLQALRIFMPLRLSPPPWAFVVWTIPSACRGSPAV